MEIRDAQELPMLNGARWAVAAGFATGGFTVGVWAPQIPLLLPRYQISESTVGLIILVLGLGAIAAMLFSGRLIAAHGSRRVVIGFSLAVIPLMPMMVYAPSVWLLAIAAAFFGATIGSMDVAINAQAVIIEQRLARPIMSSIHGFWSLGGFVGGASGSFAIEHWGPEVQAWLSAGVVAMLVFGAMPFVLREDAHPSTKKTPNSDVRPAKTHLLPRDAALWILGLMTLFSLVPEGAVLDWGALYLGQELGSDMFRAGLAFSFFSGAMAIMRFVGDSLRKRIGAVRGLRVSGLIGAAGLLIAAAAPFDSLAIVGFILTGIGVANMIPIIFSATGNHPGVPSSTAIAIATMVGYAGILTAPAAIGFVAEAFGFRVTYAAIALLPLTVALMAKRAAAAETPKSLH